MDYRGRARSGAYDKHSACSNALLVFCWEGRCYSCEREQHAAITMDEETTVRAPGFFGWCQLLRLHKGQKLGPAEFERSCAGRKRVEVFVGGDVITNYVLIMHLLLVWKWELRTPQWHGVNLVVCLLCSVTPVYRTAISDSWHMHR